MEPLGSNPVSPEQPLDFDIRGLGRRWQKSGAPEGWIKKIERRREGKAWIGFFHLWTTDAQGRRVRTKKEKRLGPASMPKHEAQQKLAEYIEEYTEDSQNRAMQSLRSAICGRLSPQ
jgi:predicted Holliday junction resolvase-like endonuclease